MILSNVLEFFQQLVPGEDERAEKSANENTDDDVAFDYQSVYTKEWKGPKITYHYNTLPAT